MKTPKQQFCESAEDVRYLMELTADDRFLKALNYALLEYNHQLANRPLTDDSARFMAGQLKGAQEYMRELKALWQQPRIIERRDNTNLTHK